MKSRHLLAFGTALVVGGLLPSVSRGQANQGVLTPAAQYFAGRQVDYQPTQIGGRHHMASRQQLQVDGGKPFDHVQRLPALSPYLALDAAPESSTSLPNWHLFVQPQLQQRNAAEAQARELMRVRQQMRVATSRHIVPETPPAGVPITGSSTQFLNMGSYFPGVR